MTVDLTAAAAAAWKHTEAGRNTGHFDVGLAAEHYPISSRGRLRRRQLRSDAIQLALVSASLASCVPPFHCCVATKLIAEGVTQKKAFSSLTESTLARPETRLWALQHPGLQLLGARPAIAGSIRSFKGPMNKLTSMSQNNKQDNNKKNCDVNP